MADYKLQARIPQETADKLFSTIKDLQEVTAVADVTTSSVTRAALEQFIEEHENSKNYKYLKICLPIENLSDEEFEKLAKGFSEMSCLFEENQKLKTFLNRESARINLLHQLIK